MENNESNKGKEILKVEDLMEILRIGRNTAYNLMRSEDFPSKKIGRLWVVSRESFKDWLNNQSKK